MWVFCLYSTLLLTCQVKPGAVSTLAAKLISSLVIDLLVFMQVSVFYNCFTFNTNYLLFYNRCQYIVLPLFAFTSIYNIKCPTRYNTLSYVVVSSRPSSFACFVSVLLVTVVSSWLLAIYLSTIVCCRGKSITLCMKEKIR